MTLAAVTGAVLVADFAALVAWDVYVKVRQPSGESTISVVLNSAAHRWTVVGFAAGFVCGHLFWRL